MYQKTLLGAILNISCLLKTPGVVENHGYFLNPSRSSPQEIKVQESNIHQVRLNCNVAASHWVLLVSASGFK